MTKSITPTLLVAICLTLAAESLQGADILSSEFVQPPKPTASGELIKSPTATPSAASHSVGTELPPEVKNLLTKFSTTRDQFLDEQNALRQKYSNSSRDEREILRAEMKRKRDDFLNQQKEAREDLRRRLAELKPSVQTKSGQ